MARPRKNINIELVAQASGVSVASVSRVLNNRTDVSEKIRRRVNAVIEELQFTPARSAQRICTIGVVLAMNMPALSEYQLQILEGASACGCEEGVSLTAILYHLKNSSAHGLLPILRQRRCDGVVVVPADEMDDECDELEEAGIPTMLVNHNRSSQHIGHFRSESYSGMRQATEHLLSLGHRRIGFLAGGLVSRDHRERLCGYRDAMAAAGVEIRPEWSIAHHPTEVTPIAGVEGMRRLLEQAPEVTACLCTNDEMAMGALQEAWRQGRRVPEDLSVIGFDDLPFAPYLHPALTTVRQPVAEMGRRAVQALVRFLNGEIRSLPTGICESKLILRDSTRKIEGE